YPECRDIHVLGNDVWVCSDGGINYSTDELQTSESRKYGIIASDYWGFGQGWNEDVMVGGRYHNGNSGYYNTYGTGNTLRLGGAEAPTGYVSPIEKRKAYFSDINTKSLPDSLDGTVLSESSLSMYPNESYYTSYSSEVVFHPVYAHHIYLGKDSKIWKSVNEGASFEQIYSFGLNGLVLEIEMSRSNPDVMYCVFQDGGGYWDWCRIYKSTDGGYNWNVLPTLNTNRFRLEIAINPFVENELWVCSKDGDNGEKVFRTTDGGISWQNMSSALLDDNKTLDIQFQAGGDIVYLACDNGVYYYDIISGNWVDFSMGLPASTRALEMIPFYKESKIRLATTGRGIWERDFAGASQISALPMTKTDTIFCSRDTVQFDCNSVINHTGASWAWSFSPSVSFIDSDTIRNPKVVFGIEGGYDVSLTITDSAGNTSTKSFANMIEVMNNCNPDTVPGFALECYNTGDYAATGNMNISTGYLTITAWVKPNGIQNEYTGIVINNGTTAGFNFKANNQLGYHWPDGAWWWNSNLFIPEDEWSYVAMVATPDSITLYLNGESSTHISNLLPVDLTTLDIGSYKGWSTRNYVGLIDEVCLWNRALDRDEIRLMRHLTKESLVANDPDLISYYQFNEVSGQVLDKNGIFHATMRGGSARVSSSIPVGKGTSSKQFCNSASLFSFSDEGLDIDFPASGTWPNGEIVVTHLNYLPAAMPNNYPNLGSYWIVNNYGDNQQITSLNELVFYPGAGELSALVIADPSKAVLY
ncbi:MAG: LamG-like jellyroll fold domain-containing protein, partial [Bacteroidota bacterium]|nr:LamG-like jellyroll fold domain-containing protein [Bacteroidota bacterium]